MDPTILEQVLHLPERDRVKLVEKLLESLGEQADALDDDVDSEAFRAEIKRRSDEIDNGTVELTPWSELKNEPW